MSDTTEGNLRRGPLSVSLRESGPLQATLHATGRKLETEIRHFAENPDRSEPFNTLDFVVDETRIELFLSDAQLEALAGQLANEIALRRESGSL